MPIVEKFKMKKKVFIISILSIILLFFIFSCTSVPGTYVYPSTESNLLYFFRPTNIKLKNDTVFNLNYDITFQVIHGTDINLPKVNYSLTTNSQNADVAKLISFMLINDDIECIPISKTFVFKQLDNKKNVVTRYTSEFAAKDFRRLIDGNSIIKIKLLFEDGSFIEVNCEKLNERISDLRLVL